jgi:hypothetical protein
MSPKFYEGPSYTKDDVHLGYKYYTYPIDAGLVSAGLLSVRFTIDRPAREIWPFFKDFNLWQNGYGYSYSGVVGELEGKTFKLDVGGKVNLRPYIYEVIRVIPGHLLVVSEPIPPGSNAPVRPGFHNFILSEFGGKTVMLYEGDHVTCAPNTTEEDALGPWRELAAKVIPMWRDSFIPTLKKLVYEGAKAKA